MSAERQGPSGPQSGVAAERLPIPPTLDGERLDRVLCLIWDLRRSEATELIASGAVRLGGRPAGTRARRVVTGQELEVVLRRPRSTPPSPARPATTTCPSSTSTTT